MEQSRAQLGEPRCAVQMAAPHRLLAGRVQQHRRGLRGGMTARPIVLRGGVAQSAEPWDAGSSPAPASIYRLHGVTPRVADGTFAAGSRVAGTRSNRLRGGTAGIFYTRRDSQPPALNKPGEGNGSSCSRPSGGLPPSQHLGYPDGGGLISMCESRQLPTPRAPARLSFFPSQRRDADSRGVHRRAGCAHFFQPQVPR